MAIAEFILLCRLKSLTKVIQRNQVFRRIPKTRPILANRFSPLILRYIGRVRVPILRRIHLRRTKIDLIVCAYAAGISISIVVPVGSLL